MSAAFNLLELNRITVSAIISIVNQSSKVWKTIRPKWFGNDEAITKCVWHE